MKLFEEFKLYENMWEDTNAGDLVGDIPANQQNQIAGDLRFSARRRAEGKVPVSCPGMADGCDKSFLKADEYNAHIVTCKKARKHFTHKAIVKNKKTERRLDIMDNITSGELLDYLEQHTKCELCGTPLAMKDRRPDHYHLEIREDGVGNGHFRGVLCNRCNTFIGCLEKLLIDYDVALNKIEKYLTR